MDKQNINLGVVSTVLLDSMLSKVLKANDEGIIELPAVVSTAPGSLFGKDIRSLYRPEDIEWVYENVTSVVAGSDIEDQYAVHSLLAWMWLNTGSLFRSALGIIGSLIAPSRYNYNTNENKASLLKNNKDITRESGPMLRKLIRESVEVESLVSKLPSSPLLWEYVKGIKDHCEIYRKAHHTSTEIIQKEVNQVLLNYENGVESDKTQMTVSEAAHMALIENVNRMANYKTHETHSKIRSFLTSLSTMLSIARVREVYEDGLPELASDILDILHSVERSLSSQGSIAKSLMKRAKRGDIIYDEMFDWGSHQHRLMAVEFEILLPLVSYFIRKASDDLNQDELYKKHLIITLRYSGILDTYIEERNKERS